MKKKVEQGPVTGDISAAWEGVNAIQEQNKRLQKHQEMNSRIIHNLLADMQAAWVEAYHNGAGSGMGLVENTLSKLDLLPCTEDLHFHDAGAWRNYYDYDAVKKRENQEASIHEE